MRIALVRTSSSAPANLMMTVGRTRCSTTGSCAAQLGMRTPVTMGGPRLYPAFVLDPDAEAAAQQVRGLFQDRAQLENVGRGLLPDPPDTVTKHAKVLRLPVSILCTRRLSIQRRSPLLVVLPAE